MKGIKKLAVLALALSALSACAVNPRPKPSKPPTPPVAQTGTLTIRVFGSNGSVALNAAKAYATGIFETKTDEFGRAFATITYPTRFGLCAALKDYITQCQDTEIKVAGDLDKTLTLGYILPPVTSAGEHGPLHRDGIYIRHDDNQLFRWVGSSDFSLFALYARGVDITPILDQRIALGFKILRVFGMFDQYGIGGAQGSAIGEFSVRNTPDYYVKLRKFADLLASRGLRMEYVYFADAECRNDDVHSGCLIPDRTAKQAHIDNVRSALLGTWNVAHELCNECFKNFDSPETYTIDPALGIRAYGVETLDPGQTTIVHLDYIGRHDHDRGLDWMRTARALSEIRDGFGWGEGLPDYQGSGTSVTDDEPMGFDEIEKPGSRTTNANDAADSAGLANLMGMGSTFHSTDGIASRLFRPLELEAAKAWVFGANFAPPEVQSAPYQRGSAGCDSGIGNMPLLHCDEDSTNLVRALRTFCKTAFGFEWCVAIRPSATWVATPLRGCTIVNEPRKGFVQLSCP